MDTIVSPFPRKPPLAGILLLSVLLSSCTTISEKINKTFRPETPESAGAAILAGHGPIADINGFKPEGVFLKTPTQTFCKGYEFCLVDGLIYQKTESGTWNATGASWKPIDGTGLPRSRETGFVPPRRIVEISADADTLLAFSDEGRLYQYYLERTTVTKAFTWKDTFGWPDKSPLVQDPLVLGNRGWAVGVRRGDVLWYEDIYGNQHHFGTMGIETLYFLSKDGTEIRYADTGLPADFSHGLLGPERGSFAAVSISASASTIFLIGETGEMYTRLADFDTVGNDPMFYKYTYLRERYPYAGSDYRSNFTPWALPPEDWKKEPPLPLSGKARISSSITILQTGRGNFARELRVAGLSPEGTAGYYYKNIREDEWAFKPCPLAIGESLFLDAAGVPAVAGDPAAPPRGERKEYAYAGSLLKNGERVPGLAFDIPDFSLTEGGCHLTVSYKGETCTLELFPVQIWTYMRRYDPGRDGTPKYFFITVSVPDNIRQSISAEFSGLLEPLFLGRHLTLFSCRAEATSSYFLMDFGSAGPDDSSLFLTRGKDSGISPDLVRKSAVLEDPLIMRFLDPDLIIGNPDRLTSARMPEIRKILADNVAYRGLMQGELERYEKYRAVAGISRYGYEAFDLLATVTMMNKLDFPKIKTATQFAGDVMKINETGYSFMEESRKWLFSNILELLDIRIAEYASVLGQLESGREFAAVNPSMRNTFPDYFDLLGLPRSVEGKNPSDQAETAMVGRIDGSPLFPGLLLTAGSSRILIELENPAKRIGESDGTQLGERPFRTGAIFHPVDRRKPADDEKSRWGMAGEVEWDGSRLRIWRTRYRFFKTLIFDGTAESVPVPGKRN